MSVEMVKSAKHLVEVLSQSQIYKDYEQAYSNATGMPLALRSVEIWNPALNGKPNENPFCTLMAKSSRSCASCLETQQKLSSWDQGKTCTIFCFAGLHDSTIPVRCGEDVIGFLQTGQVLCQKPSKSQFKRVTKQLMDWGVNVDLKQLEDAYFHSKILSPKKYKATLRLLEIFASHLAIVANQIAIQQQAQDPVMIQKAKEYIRKHRTEDISLGDVAKAVNASAFYFCKMFKKVTGFNFTAYLSRVRVDKAKNLLLNPNARVGEIAFDVGFQSITHFNRVFLKIAGESPTDYRKKLPKIAE